MLLLFRHSFGVPLFGAKLCLSLSLSLSFYFVFVVVFSCLAFPCLLLSSLVLSGLVLSCAAGEWPGHPGHAGSAGRSDQRMHHIPPKNKKVILHKTQDLNKSSPARMRLEMSFSISLDLPARPAYQAREDL